MTITIADEVTTGPDDDGGDAVLSAELEALLAGSVSGSSTSDDDDDGPERRPNRVALSVALPGFGAAVMVGGVFEGATPRIYAGVGIVAGVLLGLSVRKLKGTVVLNLAVFLGVAFSGLIALGFTGFANISHVTSLVQTSISDGDVLRPPIEFTPGWHAIIVWLAAGVGFSAVWVAIVFDKPTLGLLLPIPFAVLCGISVPQNAQVVSGIICVVLLAAGLGVLSGAVVSGDNEQRPSLGYELRRAVRGIALIAVLAVALVGISRANFLFPKPKYDPAHQAQLPKAAPLTDAPNRPLFTVSSPQGSLGPWRQGSLDVYDGTAWRLAPVADADYVPVDRTGIVDHTQSLGITANFTILGYQGAVLPGLSQTFAVQVNGPAVEYDTRNDNIRLVEGQVTKGLTYKVGGSALPTLQEAEDASKIPVIVNDQQFMSIPAEPPAVTALLSKEHDASPFATFNNVRTYILNNVTAVGPGVPVAVPPSKVTDMIGGSKKASPFEIVAANAMLARWAGLPSRIAYGFYGGTKQGDHLVVTPAQGTSYVEVYLGKYGWVPIIGNPKHAQASSNSSAEQNHDTDATPDNTFAGNVFLPTVTPASSGTADTVLAIIGLSLGVALLLYIIYFFSPAITKLRRRNKLRAAAAGMSPKVRIALAYSEWRDLATDYGYRYDADPPLGFLTRFAPDEEHAELAWLVTRTLWGDLRQEVTEDMAVTADELARALRRRMAQAHPLTVRVLAALSRLSVRNPYSTELVALLDPRKERSRASVIVPALNSA